jgi:microcystin-dependent protein
MKIKIEMDMPRWLSRAILLGVPVAVVAIGAWVFADVPNTFKAGDTVSSQKLNDNFAAVTSQINAFETQLATIQNQSVPAGAVLAFAGTTPPPGFLLCDGSAVSRTQYSSLFAVIQILYGGGDGVITFNLPDLRGIFPKGAGSTNRANGQDASGNFYAGTLGAYSTDKMQGHKVFAATPEQETSAVAALTSVNSMKSSMLISGYYSAYILSGSVSAPTVGLSSGPTSDGANGTPRVASTTEPQSLSLNYIIKY